jgi:hypothetical protein
MTTRNGPDGGQTIGSLVTLRQAGRLLSRNPSYIKGVADGLGIKLQSASNALVMTAKDFGRIKRLIESEKARDPEPAATT